MTITILGMKIPCTRLRKKLKLLKAENAHPNVAGMNLDATSVPNRETLPIPIFRNCNQHEKIIAATVLTDAVWS